MGFVKEGSPVLSSDYKTQVLSRIISILDCNSINYWLEFGTLLGCVRDNDFISWDSDIDIGVFDIEAVKNCRDDFLLLGFDVVFERETLVPIVRIYDKLFKDTYFYVDIYGFISQSLWYEYHWYIRKNIICRSANYLMKLFDKHGVLYDWLYKICNRIDTVFSIHRVILFKPFETKETLFNGLKVRIPCDAIDHLLVNYGVNWDIPLRVTQTGGDEFLRYKYNGVEYCWL